MRRWIVCALCLGVLALGLAGCGGAAIGAEQTIKVGFTLAAQDEFLNSLESAVVKAAYDEDIKLEVKHANNDQQAQTQQIERWAEQEYAAAIIVLCDEDAAAEVLEKAGDMPIVFLNRRPADSVIQSRPNVVYVGVREPDAGRMQGEYLVNYFENLEMHSPQIVVLGADDGNTAGKERIKAAKKVLSDSKLNVTYLKEIDAQWKRSDAQKQLSGLLRDKPKIDAVLAANDEMAIGAAAALSQSGYAIVDIPIVGVDATTEGVAALRDGRIDFTVYQSAVDQGAGAVEVVMALLGGTQPEGVENSVRWVRYEGVTVDNVDQLFPKE